MILDFIDSLNLNELNHLSVVLRLVLSTIFGGVLGLDRTRKRHAAGMRTYILVCQGACIAMMCGQFITQFMGTGDASRIGAQVISGIGFLGAGTILLTGNHQIRGLTTAAGIWSTACMGLAFGVGFYWGGLVLFVLMYVVMTLFDQLQRRVTSKSPYLDVYIVFNSFHDVRGFLDFIQQREWTFRDFNTTRLSKQDEIGLVTTLKLPERHSHEDVINILTNLPGVLFVEEVRA